MTLTIELAPEVEARLATKAQQFGLNVREYAQRVLQQDVNGEQPQGVPSAAPTEEAQARHHMAVSALYGKYAGRGSSVDEFCRRKQEEIDLEEAKDQRRHPETPQAGRGL